MWRVSSAFETSFFTTDFGRWQNEHFASGAGGGGAGRLKGITVAVTSGL
jgi:hypothetical protein